MHPLIIGAPSNAEKIKITPEQQLAFLSKMREHCKSERDFALMDSIAADIGDYKKQSGCFWMVDKRGGFDLRFYISAQHMQELSMPSDDADTVSRLLQKADGASVLSGCALLMAHWIKQAKAAQARIVSAVSDTVN